VLTFVELDQRFEQDSVVVRHEFGHALAAFVLGFGVGRIAFARRDEMVLAGGARSRIPEIKLPQRELNQLVVTRLLAGEIAGRHFLGMPQDELCSEYDLSHRHHISYAKSVAHGGRDDVSRAISISCQYGQEWYTFLSKCHEQAKEIVRNGWAGVERASVIVEKMGLPKTQGQAPDTGPRGHQSVRAQRLSPRPKHRCRGRSS
jgi:hypothetical protein